MEQSDFRKAVFLDREAAQIGSLLIQMNDLAEQFAHDQMTINVSFKTKNQSKMVDKPEPPQQMFGIPMQGGIMMAEMMGSAFGPDPNMNQQVPQESLDWFALSPAQGLEMLACLKEIKMRRLREIKQEMIDLGINLR